MAEVNALASARAEKLKDERHTNVQFAGWTQGESWSLGDSPAIAIAINQGCGHYHYATAPYVADDTSSVIKEDNPQIRIYTDIDSRYVLEDFISKLEISYGDN